jgi:hypothetical protein
MPRPDETPAVAPVAPAAQPAARAADVAWLAVGSAAVATLVHVAQVEFRFRVLGVFTWTHREFAWLSLAGYLACFLAFAVPVGLLVLALRGRMRVGVVGACFAALVAFAILLFFPRLHPAAQLALAIGIGTQVGRWMSGNPAAARRWTRRVTLGAASVSSCWGWRRAHAFASVSQGGCAPFPRRRPMRPTSSSSSWTRCGPPA